MHHDASYSGLQANRAHACVRARQDHMNQERCCTKGESFTHLIYAWNEEIHVLFSVA
jgi:hypothetical protein